MKQNLFLVFLILFSANSFAQNNSTKWDKWKWLMGEWKGDGDGQPGQGEGTFSFKTDLDQMILVRKSHTEFATLKGKPAIHDDLLVIYPGYSGSMPKAVYFDNEGHSISYDYVVTDKTIVFTSQKEGIMPIFRLTYIKIDSVTVNTKFELSQDGTEFKAYMEGKSKKVKKEPAPAKKQ